MRKARLLSGASCKLKCVDSEDFYYIMILETLVKTHIVGGKTDELFDKRTGDYPNR
jgi:hypothetical protein